MDDEKSKMKRPSETEERETLHEYVGGVISNPTKGRAREETKREGDSGTESRTGT